MSSPLVSAIALPAIPAAAHDDPLAAAVDTTYFAALAHGDRHPDLLSAVTDLLIVPYGSTS